jgi:hypothetical protein
MDESTDSTRSVDDGSVSSQEQAIELWKYFGGVGGGDKNTMVQVCNWLLGFSVAIVAFAFGTKLLTKLFSEQWAFSIMSLLGFIISFVSGLVSLIYGSYANWNWAKADQIADAHKENKWRILDPDNVPWTNDQKKRGFGLPEWVVNWSTPTPRFHRLGPIFWIYFVLSMLSAAVHLTVMILANRASLVQYSPRWGSLLG